VTEREELETTLAKAEAALADALGNSANAGADCVEATANLDKVRAYCGQLRTVLLELSRSESTAKLDQARAYCRELRTVFLELNRSAAIPFRCLELSCALLVSPRTTCWLDYLEAAVATGRRLETSSNSLIRAAAPSPGQALHRFDTEFSAQEPGFKDARARPSLVRQTVGFLALVMAYLLYFHIDVQLQILSLPSIFALSLR